jgi:hypothetical protein
MPNISRMSGREWFRIIEYLVLRRVSGTRDFTSQVALGGVLAEGAGVAGAEAAALAKEVAVEGEATERGSVMTEGACGASGAELFFFLPRLKTVVHVSLNGLPARAGKSSEVGTVGGGGGAKALRVAIGGSEKCTLGAGLGEGSVRFGWVRNSLIKTKVASERGRDFL